MSAGTLHDRLATIAGNRTYRNLGELTATNHETVRRYIQGQAPSVEFLTAICEALHVSPAWLLTGQGPMRATEVRSAALGEADVSELLSALSNSLTALIERVERLEIYVQTMEARLRGTDAERQRTTPGDGPAEPGIASTQTSETRPGQARLPESRPKATSLPAGSVDRADAADRDPPEIEITRRDGTPTPTEPGVRGPEARDRTNPRPDAADRTPTDPNGRSPGQSAAHAAPAGGQTGIAGLGWHSGGVSAAGSVRRKARRIADAVAERSPADGH